MAFKSENRLINSSLSVISLRLSTCKDISVIQHSSLKFRMTHGGAAVEESVGSELKFESSGKWQVISKKKKKKKKKTQSNPVD